MFAAIVAALKRAPTKTAVKPGSRGREEIQDGIAEPPRRVLDGNDQCRRDALAALLRRHEHAGKPRVARIAFEIVEQEGSCADQYAGIIEGDEHDRHPIVVHRLANPSRARWKRLP